MAKSPETVSVQDETAVELDCEIVEAVKRITRFAVLLELLELDEDELLDDELEELELLELELELGLDELELLGLELEELELGLELLELDELGLDEDEMGLEELNELELWLDEAEPRPVLLLDELEAGTPGSLLDESKVPIPNSTPTTTAAVTTSRTTAMTIGTPRLIGVVV